MEIMFYFLIIDKMSVLGLYGVWDETILGDKCINKLYKRPPKTRDRFFKRLVASHTPPKTGYRITSAW